MQAGSANFASAREAMKSPLARKIFGTDGVKQVFFGSDFVTVTKDEDFRWAVLKPDILAAIADHMASGHSITLIMSASIQSAEEPTAGIHSTLSWFQCCWSERSLFLLQNTKPSCFSF